MKVYKQKNKKSHYSNHWSTPDNIYVHYVYDNDYYDPCPLYDESFDFNIDNYYGNMFINPPYSDINIWIDYAIDYHKKYPYTNIVMLVPARTDTKWFHKSLNHGVHIEFIKGRLKFGDSKTSAPFPSIFIHFEKS